jgi:hypothetical protein
MIFDIVENIIVEWTMPSESRICRICRIGKASIAMVCYTRCNENVGGKRPGEDAAGGGGKKTTT